MRRTVFFEPMPELDDWRAAVPDLKRVGNEFKGPCPICGGTDRFWVRQGNAGKTIFGCRGCDPRRANPDAFKAILEAVFPARNDARHSNSRAKPKKPRGGHERTPRTRGRVSGSDTNAARVAAVWSAAGSDCGTVTAYFAQRGVWPPSRPLPDNVRWLPADTAMQLRVSGLRLPKDAAGCTLFAYGPDDAPSGLHWEPLTADGTRLFKRRCVAGSRMSGAAFRVPGLDNLPLHIAEGPADALAIAIWCGVEAWAAGGRNLKPFVPALAASGRAVVIEIDGDEDGRQAATVLQVALIARGVKTRLKRWADGCDPAVGRADAWRERVAIMEFDARMDRRDAEAAAWNELYPAGEESRRAQPKQSPPTRN